MCTTEFFADVMAEPRLVVGHSLGANIALEMAAVGIFTGPVVLLSPAFSRGDESTALALGDAVARVPVLDGLAWTFVMKVICRGWKCARGATTSR